MATKDELKQRRRVILAAILCGGLGYWWGFGSGQIDIKQNIAVGHGEPYFSGVHFGRCTGGSFGMSYCAYDARGE